MRTYDISLPITQNLPVWPGDPTPRIERISKMEEGAESNISQIFMSVHAGTHIDAPFHFLGGSSLTIEKIPLQTLIGRVYVLHLDDEVNLVTASILENVQIPPRTRRLLIKTRNSKLWKLKMTGFDQDFVALSPDGAHFLVDRGIRLIGVDYLSVAPYASPAATHEVLLNANVVVLEGLDLSEVSQGRYSLYCLPLKIIGTDGAPARVVLIGV